MDRQRGNEEDQRKIYRKPLERGQRWENKAEISAAWKRKQTNLPDNN